MFESTEVMVKGRRFERLLSVGALENGERPAVDLLPLIELAPVLAQNSVIVEAPGQIRMIRAKAGFRLPDRFLERERRLFIAAQLAQGPPP
jgi:hypothetical protein